MKKLAIGIMAVTLIGSSAMFAEDTVTTTAQTTTTIQSADQTSMPGMDMKNCPMTKGDKKDCGGVANGYADKAQMFKDKAAKATTKGDAKLADLYNKCSTAAQSVSDQMNAMMKLKADCKANSSCSAMMMDQGKGCGAMTPKSCMKMAQKCEKMSQKMAQKAGSSADTSVAADAKAVSEMQSKMADQYKAVASAEEALGKAQSDLKDYMKSLKQAKKDAKAQQSND
ncbi:MAG: hypothetical protein WCR55_11655 [Lentisphaerota bacterium]